MLKVMSHRGFLIGGTLILWVIFSGIAAATTKSGFVSWPATLLLLVLAFAVAFALFAIRRRVTRSRQP